MDVDDGDVDDVDADDVERRMMMMMMLLMMKMRMLMRRIGRGRLLMRFLPPPLADLWGGGGMSTYQPDR